MSMSPEEQYVGAWAVGGTRSALQYTMLLDNLLGDAQVGNIANYEPCYLRELIRTHPYAVKEAYDEYLQSPFRHAPHAVDIED
jgi:hypothetical protein